MEPYIHKVQYYETDRMGITHHSNYIRWMEEARTAFLEEIGWPYDKTEEEGLLSPVLAVNCQYRMPTTFGDQVAITVKILKISPVKFTVGYEMHNVATGSLVVNGTTEHCMLNKDRKLVRFNLVQPELYRIFQEMAEVENQSRE
ncbi:MAG: acyl-CoA thioesterase [Lachnospiraceae bacterium]